MAEKARVLFINPPYERLKGLTVESIPMGLLSLATVLKERGYTPKVYDADTSFAPAQFAYDNTRRAETQAVYLKNLQNDELAVWQEIRQVIKDFHPDIVCVTLLTPAFSSFKKVLEIVDKLNPRPLLLAGGPHVTICKEAALQDHPQIDFGFVAEAELTLVEFLGHFYSPSPKTPDLSPGMKATGELLRSPLRKPLGEAEVGFGGMNLQENPQRNTATYGGEVHSDKKYQDVKGLLYREQGRILYSGDRAFIDNLDSLPFPDRSLLHNEQLYRPAKLAQLMTSRGCPFECTFCASVPLWQRRVRRRSPAKLLEEVEYVLDRYHIRSFEFWDDTFTTSKKDVLEFCRLINRRYPIRKPVWKCLTNINCLDEEILDNLKRAGCCSVSIGIESGSDRILKLMKKKITTDQVRRVVKMIKSKGFWIDAFFMVGIPQETEEDIRASIDFIKELQPDTVNLCTFTPYVGTELYRYVVDKGFLTAGDYGVYDRIGHHSTFNYFLENIPRERYQVLLKEILDVATSMTNRNTPRKYWLKLQKVTWEKIIYRLKQGLGPKRG
jgi:anaerobic magnesium-protoporphyrin IX monomethyl ester cyclase